MLSLFDTAAKSVQKVEFRDGETVNIYVCGPTVYDQPHLGHGRAVLTYDTLRRYLEWCGYRVNHVSNVTDVEDKIIARAEEEGRPESEVTAEYEAIWWKAMDQLGALRPTHTPHATEYIDQMQKLIGELLEAGYAYETSDGIYFDVAKLDGYGLLAGQSVDELRAGARVEVVEEKKSPVDFALWKKVDAADQLTWDSPWGKGRPGWHTECVVMSLDILGDGFDIHSGGLDLKFPHHENERAQAVALGKKFANHWMHHGFVEFEGEKMSKSLGNFTTLNDLIERADPRAYRLLCLQSHYRAPIEVTPETIAAAEAATDRLDDFARRTQDLPGDPIDSVLDEFKALMDDDLDTPSAMALIFEYVRRTNVALDEGIEKGAGDMAASVKELLGAVGLELKTGNDAIDDESNELISARDAARAAKDFKKSDELRDQLVARGWIVEDTVDGTRVHR